MYSADYLSRYPFFRDALQNVPLNVMHDALTGLVARSYILRFVQSLIHDQTPFSLLIIDLDNFKSINDNYGHRTGDAMLESVAADLTRFVGEDGVAGRFGGDEFLIVYFGSTDYDGMHVVLDAMYAEGGVFRKNLRVAGKVIFSTATVGCAIYPKDADSFDGLFALSDKTLYRGKSKGRNCFIIYVPEKHAHLEIPKLAQRSLYDTFARMAEGFDKGGDISEKLLLAFHSVQDNMHMQRLFLIDSDMQLIDPDSGVIGHVESPEALMRNGLYGCHTFEELEQSCPALTKALSSMYFESVMLTQVARPGRAFGYLAFCPEVRTMHIWQESECAAAFFLARMLAVYLEQHEM